MKVHRSNVYAETIGLYSNNTNIVHQLPIKVRFQGEMGVDTGGLGRDFFSAFWDEAYRKMFEGSSILIPAVHAHIEMSSLPVLGKIISHGYLSSGHLPVRIAFPTLAAILLGPTTEVPSRLLIQAFHDYLSPLDRSCIREAVKVQKFGSSLSEKLVSILSRFECRQMPSPSNLSQLVLQIAQHEFISRPFAAITLMHSGIVPKHKSFWGCKSVVELNSLYVALTASAHKVLDLIEEPVFLNPGQERVFGYLQQYVANMKPDEVQNFLRFVTGSAVCMKSKITVSFNGLEGLARRPLAHMQL